MQMYRKKEREMKKYIIPAIVGAVSALAVVVLLVKKKKKATSEITE